MTQERPNIFYISVMCYYTLVLSGSSDMVHGVLTVLPSVLGTRIHIHRHNVFLDLLNWFGKVGALHARTSIITHYYFIFSSTRWHTQLMTLIITVIRLVLAARWNE